MSTRTAFAVRLALPALLVASPAVAQDVQYETVSKVEFAGGFGRMMRIAQRMSGSSGEVVQTTYIKGNKMRTDTDQSSTITDLDAKRMIVLDHKAKTYTSMTFEEAAAAMNKAAADMKASTNQRSTSGSDAAQHQVNFKFNVDRANDNQTIAGYPANRVFLTAEMEGEFTPEGGTERQKGGSLVVLTDMWTSKDVPAFKALSTFQDASAKQFANAGSAVMEGFAAMFADDPRFKVGFERSASEAKKIEGMPVRTVTTFVSVLPGQKFDRALATAQPKQGPGIAQQAAKSAFGRLRGAAQAAAASATGGSAGGSQPSNDQNAQQDPNATQATMFTVTSEIRNVNAKSLDASLFAPPSNYREVKP